MKFKTSTHNSPLSKDLIIHNKVVDKMVNLIKNKNIDYPMFRVAFMFSRVDGVLELGTRKVPKLTKFQKSGFVKKNKMALKLGVDTEISNNCLTICDNKENLILDLDCS
jgi:hypothetical protein